MGHSSVASMVLQWDSFMLVVHLSRPHPQPWLDREALRPRGVAKFSVRSLGLKAFRDCVTFLRLSTLGIGMALNSGRVTGHIWKMAERP